MLFLHPTPYGYLPYGTMSRAFYKNWQPPLAIPSKSDVTSIYLTTKAYNSKSIAISLYDVNIIILGFSTVHWPLTTKNRTRIWRIKRIYTVFLKKDQRKSAKSALSAFYFPECTVENTWADDKLRATEVFLDAFLFTLHFWYFMHLFCILSPLRYFPFKKPSSLL